MKEKWNKEEKKKTWAKKQTNEFQIKIKKKIYESTMT